MQKRRDLLILYISGHIDLFCSVFVLYIEMFLVFFLMTELAELSQRTWFCRSQQRRLSCLSYKMIMLDKLFGLDQ